MRSLIGVAFLGLIGCSKPTPPPLFTEAEIAALEAKLAATTPAVSCARPLVRTAPPYATAVDLDKRLVLPAECDGIDRALANPAARPPVPNPSDPQVELLSAPNAEACLKQVTHIVASAVSHQAVCAIPYSESSPLLPVFVIGKVVALAVHERSRYAFGDAMMLALDGIRFAQDTERGSGTLVQAMASVAAQNVILDRAAIPLSQQERVRLARPEEVDDAIRGVDLLLATTPPFHDVLTGEINWIATERGTRALAAPDDANVAWRRSHWAAAAAIQLALTVREHVSSACPPTASLNACRPALKKLDDAGSSGGDAARTKILADGWDTETRTKTRDRLLAMDLASIGWSDYAIKYGAPLVRLAVLRFQLEVVKREVRCPDAAQLVDSPWKEILAPAALGDALRAERTPAGYTLKAPEWMPRETQTWTIACR